MDVRIPGDAIDAAGQDLLVPSQELLAGLNLLPPLQDLSKAKGAHAAVGGPPETVALIEAGATAFGKWWSAGAGVAVLGIWGSVAKFYRTETHPETQRTLLWGAAIVTAALVLAIAYVIDADLRGRAAVQVATVTARADVARILVGRATGGDQVAPSTRTVPHPRAAELGLAPTVAVPLARQAPVAYTGAIGPDEQGWQVLAMMPNAEAEKITYLIAKGQSKLWVDSGQLIF